MKSNFIKIILGLSMCAILANASSATDQCTNLQVPSANNTKTVGGGAGFVQGMGISYRQWFEKHGFQINALPIISIRGESQDLYLSLGATYLRALWESPAYKFLFWPSRNLVYSYTGIHYIGSSIKDFEDPYWQQNYMTQHIYAGSGLGLQMNIRAIQISLGLGFAGSVEKHQDWEENEFPALRWRIHPTVDAQIGYTFGW